MRQDEQTYEEIKQHLVHLIRSTVADEEDARCKIALLPKVQVTRLLIANNDNSLRGYHG